jgi:hypothetical protein
MTFAQITKSLNPRFNDLTNKVFGKLRVVGYAGTCERRSPSAYFCHFERRQSLGCLPSSMRKAMLVAAIALVLGSTVTASDNARDWPYFEGPQQYLINNLGEVLREQHALESCSQQQQEALQRFLNMGISYNAAALMAHSQYPCDSTDQ